MERDAKACFDVLTRASQALWLVSSVISNINELRNSFECWNLCWVRRVANEVAHTMEEFASPLRWFLSCNKTSLLEVVETVSYIFITCSISHIVWRWRNVCHSATDLKNLASFKL